MNSKALEILSKLTTSGTTRQKRLTTLLKPAELEYTDDWFMCVRKAFNDTLDIRKTERVIEKKKVMVWTQGSAFNFCEGDILYNTKDAYNQNWQEALKHISLCVQVMQSVSAGPTTDGAGWSAGSITFNILKPNSQRSQLVIHSQFAMTQEAFVQFLIGGPTGALAAQLNDSQAQLF